MTSVIDMVDEGVDPQEEVVKLQNLVKRLETQNEILRQKQSDNLKSVNNSVFYNRKKSERKDSTSNESADLVDIELIDIEKCVNDREESWLYSSPRPLTPLQTKVNPYKWLRQDFDSPTPAIQSAKKSLKFKLDEVARMSRSSSAPVFQSQAPPKPTPTNMSLSADSTSTPRFTPSMRSLKGLEGKVNTGTFTRPKKKDKPSPTEVNGDDTKENLEAVHHPNVADIENMAKLQEESLRQSIAQTSPRREGMNRRNSTNSIDSDQSSPSDSPYGSNQHLNNTNPGNLRGSLQNVSRLVPRAQHHNSDSSLTDYQSEESFTQPTEPIKHTSRIQQSQLQRPSSPSLSGLRKPQRSLRGPSPARTGLPTPTRRSIPRPGSAGTPRSGLPAPRSRVIPKKV